MKVLLTGSAGFIASFVARRLLERGNEVVGLDNVNGYYDTALKYGRLKEAGIREEEVDWYKLTPSHTYEKYRFIRMNLEDRQAMRMLSPTRGSTLWLIWPPKRAYVIRSRIRMRTWNRTWMVLSMCWRDVGIIR